MKNSSGREKIDETTSHELSCEALEQLAGGYEAIDYWNKLVLACDAREKAFDMLIRDTTDGKVSVGIADYLVDKIEGHYNQVK